MANKNKNISNFQSFSEKHVITMNTGAQGCHNKLPQTWWLKTAEVYSSQSPGAGKSSIEGMAVLPPEALGDSALGLPGSGGLRFLLACGCLTPPSTFSLHGPPLPPCVSYKLTCHWAWWWWWWFN